MALNDVGEIVKELDVINIKYKRSKSLMDIKEITQLSSFYMPLLWSEIISFTFSFGS